MSKKSTIQESKNLFREMFGGVPLSQKQLQQRKAAAQKAAQWNKAYASLIRKFKAQKRLNNIEEEYEFFNDKMLRKSLRAYYQKKQEYNIKQKITQPINLKNLAKDYITNFVTKTMSELKETKAGKISLSGDLFKIYEIIHNNEAYIYGDRSYIKSNKDSILIFEASMIKKGSNHPEYVEVTVDATDRNTFLNSLSQQTTVQLNYLFTKGYSY